MDNTKEIWKDVPGYEKLYQISNLGRVKSIPKISGSGLGFMTKEKILKQQNNGNGYKVVHLSKNSKIKKNYVHQLVAITFISKDYLFHKKVVDHIDNNRKNNKLENIQIVSQRFNCSKDKKIGTSKYTGVSRQKTRKKWKAQINIKNERIFLGEFITEYEAHLAYQKALKKWG